MENAKKMVFHVEGGRHASFPQKPVVKPYGSMMFFGNIVRRYDTSIKKVHGYICTWFVGPEKKIYLFKKNMNQLKTLQL